MADADWLDAAVGPSGSSYYYSRPPVPPPIRHKENGADFGDTMRQILFLILLFVCQQPQLIASPCIALSRAIQRGVECAAASISSAVRELIGDESSETPRTREPVLPSPPRRIILHSKLARFQARLDRAVADSAAAQNTPITSEAIRHAERRAYANRYRAREMM